MKDVVPEKVMNILTMILFASVQEDKARDSVLTKDLCASTEKLLKELNLGQILTSLNLFLPDHQKLTVSGALSEKEIAKLPQHQRETVRLAYETYAIMKFLERY